MPKGSVWLVLFAAVLVFGAIIYFSRERLVRCAIASSNFSHWELAEPPARQLGVVCSSLPQGEICRNGALSILAAQFGPIQAKGVYLTLMGSK